MEIELFVGLGLPKNETVLVDTIRKEFSPKNRIGSPSHITLIGPFFELEPDKLIENIKLGLEDIPPFEAEFRKIGVFNQAKYVTFYLEPEVTENFIQLKRSIEVSSGIKPEIREFIPHLTIANQIPYSKKEETYARLQMLGLRLRIIVDSVILFTKEKDKSWEVWRKLSIGNN